MATWRQGWTEVGVVRTVLLAIAIASGPAFAKKPKKPDPSTSSDPAPLAETQAPTKMTNERLHAFVVNLLGEDLAPAARKAPNNWEFELEGMQVLIVTDERADRMRIMVPITPVENLPSGFEARLLQANFDAVLDSRYAIARGIVWSVFIHPLSPLDNRQLGSGLAQVVTAAATFGTTFTSGAFVFGGGDTSGIHAELYRKILERSEIEEQGI